MRGRRVADADATAQQNWHLKPSAAHVLHLGNLIRNLTKRIQNEISEHEVDHRARAGHGRPAAEADESALANRGVTQPLRAVKFVQPGRRAKIAATLSDALTHDKDRWVARHFGCKGLKRGLGE